MQFAFCFLMVLYSYYGPYDTGIKEESFFYYSNLFQDILLLMPLASLKIHCMIHRQKAPCPVGLRLERSPKLGSPHPKVPELDRGSQSRGSLTRGTQTRGTPTRGTPIRGTPTRKNPTKGTPARGVRALNPKACKNLYRYFGP